jgi:hypothetical protein
MGGATRHKPGCEIAALIRAYVDPSVGPPPNRRQRSREARNPDWQAAAIGNRHVYHLGVAAA